MGIRIPLHLYLSPQPNSKLTEYCPNKTFPELCTKLTDQVAQIFVHISPSIVFFHFDDFHHTRLEYLVLQMRILGSIVISDQDMQFIFCENGDNTARLELKKDSKTQLRFTGSK